MVEQLRYQQEDEGLPGEEPLEEAHGRQAVGAIALGCLEEQDQGGQRDKQHDLLVQESHVGQAADHRQHPDGCATTLQNANALASHLEAAVEVLVEIPNDEQQPRCTQDAAQSEEARHAPIVERLAQQRGHQDGKEHVRNLGRGHQQVRRNSTRQHQPEQGAERHAGIEDGVLDVVRQEWRALVARGLQQRLPGGGHDVAQGDDRVNSEILGAHQGLHEPLCDVVALRQPLLCEADISLQDLSVLDYDAPPLLVLGHRFFHDVVDPLFAHRLRQKLHVVIDVEHLHLVGNDRSLGLPAEGALLPVLQLVANDLDGVILQPQLV
mmetsp:Transcript_117491/g.339652  ORF Transcript_117491/g.339652 Transcript_117491/m.339652 type:complete len:323 (+) Transcript_117491:784-1752(+)